jgi:hypothetical protein
MSPKSIILIFLLINILINQAKSEQSISDCLIHNLKYSFEYLHIERDDKSNRLDLSTLHLGSIDDYSNIRWLIEPVNIVENKTFYIRTHKFAKRYLCGSNKLDDLFKMRRIVETRNEKSSECEWRLNSLSNSFRITNVYYNQPLYAASFLFKKKLKRNVYLWHKKSTSNEFGWIVDCMKGFYMII